MDHVYELTKELLFTPTAEFDFDNPPMDPKELYFGMRNSLIKHGGIGLACNQVGLPYSMFVVGDPKRPDEIVGVFNPQVVYKSEKTVIMSEGCLSFPGLSIKRKRPEEIRVRFQTWDGERGSRTFKGLTARTFFHEIEHLQGSVFTFGANRANITLALKKASKNGYSYTMKEILKDDGD